MGCSTLSMNECVHCTVLSDSATPWTVQPTRLLWSWNSSDKNIGEGCHFLLQGIILTQGSYPSLLHCRWILYCRSDQGSRLSQGNYKLKRLLTPYCIKCFMDLKHKGRLWIKARANLSQKESQCVCDSGGGVQGTGTNRVVDMWVKNVMKFSSKCSYFVSKS